jgi:hypothetical protein
VNNWLTIFLLCRTSDTKITQITCSRERTRRNPLEMSIMEMVFKLQYQELENVGFCCFIVSHR